MKLYKNGIGDFNCGWTFSKLGGKSVIVNLPHDAMLTEERREDCPNGINTGYFPGGKYLYEKKFMIHESDMGKYIAIFFEGVYRNCTVKINGVEVGNHRYGYTEFTVDISKTIVAGENIVTVLVDNSLEPNSRWYSGSGIYREVSLIIRDQVHINKLRVKTLSYSPAVIEVLAEATGNSEDEISVEIYDGETRVSSGVPGEFTIPKGKLWSEYTPYLYTCVARVGTDEHRIMFGICKLEWSAKTGLLVNGVETLLRGGCVHHDNGILGGCAFADAEERRVMIMKEAGYNAIRSAHNPCSRAMLDAADKLGMYIMDEAYDGWYTPKTYHDSARSFYEDYHDVLKTMVERDYSHPSVIMYSIGNEVSEIASDKGVQLAGEMVEYIKNLDDTRPITCGVNVLLNVYTNMGMGVYKDKGCYKAEQLPPVSKKHKEKKTGSTFFNAVTQKLGPLMFFMSKGKKGDRVLRAVAEKLDIIGLNYAASRYDDDTVKYPNRMMVGSETMIGELPYNWERVKKYKAIIGDFAWAAFDYIGEAGIGSWTYHSYPGKLLLAGAGVIDITGKLDAECYYQQIVWGVSKTPYLGVRPLNHSIEMPSKSAWRFTNAIDSWNWRGYEGVKAVVEVFSDADAIRLLLNDVEVGTKRLKNYKAIFNTKYANGILKAIALDAAGNIVSETTLKTGSEKTNLSVKANKTCLSANGQDLCFLEIEFTDDDGNLKPAEERRIDVVVEGDAVLAGLGSALYKTDEVFDKTYHNTYRGRALAVLRAGYKSGKARVTVFTEGVESITTEIQLTE